jgi:hypothetical protein
MNSRYAFLLFTGLILSFYGIAQNPVSIEDKLKDTAFLKELAAKMIEATAEDYKPADHVIPDQKADYPAPSTITDAMLKEMNTAFANSFYLRPSPFSKDEIMIEFDNFFYPEPKLVTMDMKWLKAVDKSGKNFIKKNENTNASSGLTLGYNGNQTIKLVNENTNNIVRAEGEVIIKAPLIFKSISFKKNELNVDKSLDTFKVRLIRMENNLASVWVDGDYQNIQLYPYNAHEMLLESTGTSSMMIGGHTKELDVLNLPKDISDGAFIYVKTNGTIDRLDVMTVTKVSEAKLKLTALPFPVFEKGKAKPERERYIQYIPTDFTHLQMPDTNQFKSKDKLHIVKKYSEWEKQTSWSLQYALPSQYIQSSYALASFSNVTLLSKSKAIKTLESDGYLDRETGLLSVTPMNDDSKPIYFDEAKGDIILQYPVSLSTITVKKGEKKPGIMCMDGNMLSINENELGNVKDLMNSSNIEPIRVYGKGKWPLKKDSYSTYEMHDDVSLSQQYYWGNITSVQIDEPSQWINMKIPFSVKFVDPKPMTKPEVKKPVSKKPVSKKN